MVQSKAEAIRLAEATIGMSFRELNKLDTFGNTKGDNKKNKGWRGNLYQENVFGLKPNSRKEADLHHIGVELKMVPVVKDKNGVFRAKERVVCNIIAYDEEELKWFRRSSFFQKNRYVLMVFYEAVAGDALDNRIVKVLLHDIRKGVNYKQLIKDFRIIAGKIASGDAHNLSGSDTVYLEACTKGAGGDKDWRSQPNSEQMAKQRAYAFKASYVNQLLGR